MTITIEQPNTAPFSQFQTEIIGTESLLRAAITAHYRCDEREAVQSLLAMIDDDAQWLTQTAHYAQQLVSGVRAQRTQSSGVDALMQEFSLSSDEGVALMCLAEALLRIPDKQTADKLIADKIRQGQWHRHFGESQSLFVNAATWGLMLTGKLVGRADDQGLGAALTRLIGRGGEPLIRKGMDVAMRLLGNQFVTGRTIKEALQQSVANEKRGYRYSYDMLGEAAVTEADAQRYYQSYEAAIHAIGKAANGRGIKDGPGISVKLSALHPRYSRAQRTRVLNELYPRLKALLCLARDYNIGLNIDAEEADRLSLSLDLMAQLAADADFEGYDGIGFVVQAYQKRCPYVLDFLIDLARRHHRKLMIRLVKGAYWDTEIKRAQVDGLTDYPVYTRKVYSDLSYLTCAQKLLAATDVIYPQFATHNAHTVSAVWHWAEKNGVQDYEFQCLHGMGETLYNQVLGKDKLDKICRIYAPVGSHETLLPYLVRRLLENGANTSFVNQIVDENIPIESLIDDPIHAARLLGGAPHTQIPLPCHLYGNTRINSAGLDFSDEATLQSLAHAFAPWRSHQWHAHPLLGEGDLASDAKQAQPVHNPANLNDQVGTVIEASVEEVKAALHIAENAAAEWAATRPEVRADSLRRAAALLEDHTAELMVLAGREAGKTLPNAIAELREAVDFLRYYATEMQPCTAGKSLGPVVCISPWNFPLAIFIGEVSAALAAGNVVLAKPAEQTPLMAFRAVQILHEAGIPNAVLQLLPGTGEEVGAALSADTRVKGMVFTGSSEVAQILNRTLAKRAIGAQEIPLIAETGGQNALIVDSSALPEQVIQDVMLSAFDSAGQRCSALRVLCLQQDIAAHMLEMLIGAMRELQIGQPDALATDIGPVIDAQARDKILAHIQRLRDNGHTIHQVALPKACRNGYFVAPTIIEIDTFSQLKQEVFGPVLHVLRYRRERLPELVQSINKTGYGLTLGVHSRIDTTVAYIAAHAHVGNIYVNRNIVGAVVGVQPFGGEGKSGTGPKAGGPLYLKRLQTGAVTAITGKATEIDHTPLEMFIRWASTQGFRELANVGQGYQRESLLGKTLHLDGPTGERNSLSFAARGKIACIADKPFALFNQIAAVLATGNVAVVDTHCAKHLPDLPSVLTPWVLQASVLSEADLTLALIDATHVAQWRVPLAERDGALVPIVVTHKIQAIPLWRLVAERALSMNTTAAGGNASLMTLSS